MDSSETIKFASEVYRQNLWKNADVVNYLVTQRKLSKDSLESFRVGYADKRILSRVASEQGNEANVRSLQLVGSDYDFFDGYITFPVFKNDTYYNINGRAFKENPIPHKTITDIPKIMPFNPAALDKTSVIIVESPIDAITLVQHGFNSTAILSVNVTPEMVKLFDGLSCYILLDSDDSGRRGSHKLCQKLWGVAKKIYDVEFPGNLVKKEDANSYFSRNSEAVGRMKFLLKNCWPISERPFTYKPKHQTKKIKELDLQVDIVELGREIFSDHYTIDKGKELWVRCPKHKAGTEVNPSLRIGGKKNIFYCHGCVEGGGPIHLVHWFYEMNWEEAEAWLKEWYERRK